METLRRTAARSLPRVVGRVMHTKPMRASTQSIRLLAYASNFVSPYIEVYNTDRPRFADRGGLVDCDLFAF